MKETKRTPGPWLRSGNLVYARNEHGLNSMDLRVHVHRSNGNGKTGAEAIAEEEANARLIAEAGTVHHETGLTPRQLAEQRRELLDALAELISIRDSDGDEWFGSGRLDDALADAREAIAKAAGRAVER